MWTVTRLSAALQPYWGGLPPVEIRMSIGYADFAPWRYHSFSLQTNSQFHSLRVKRFHALTSSGEDKRGRHLQAQAASPVSHLFVVLPQNRPKISALTNAGNGTPLILIVGTWPRSVHILHTQIQFKNADFYFYQKPPKFGLALKVLTVKCCSPHTMHSFQKRNPSAITDR